MADWFVGPVIEKLIDACFEYFKDQVRRQTGMQEELQKLQNILPQIQAVVSTYSQVEIKDPALNKWYWQLRDAIDEADDVLDEIEYRKLEKQASKNKMTGKVRSLMKSIKRRAGEISKRAVKIDSYLKRLEVAVQKLNEISSKVSKFLHLLKSEKQNQEQQQLKLNETRETGALITNVLVGRSKEMEFVSQWLRNPIQTQSADTTDLYGNISVLSIIGHGGMGKTTLLQHIYDKDPTLFDLKMWVCVSTNFDAKTVIKNILASLKNKKSDQDRESLHFLQKSLQSEVKSKRFLLVLDDIWEEDQEKWKNVFAALRNGNPGSKILISTRIRSVASTITNMIKNNQMFRLEGLEKDECLQLFNRHAFAGGENPGGIFRDIAEKMVEKLSRCPLAVKFIGNFLKTCVNEIFWTNVLNTNIGKVKSEESSQNYLLPILKLSYSHLPSHLQNCFSFCSIFPQDYEFDKDDLVRMWIAVGFIRSSDIPGETLENTGRRYFNILVQRSFYDEFCTNDYRVYHKMHDLIYELAQSVSIKECFRVVDDGKLSIPESIRHLSIRTRSLEALEMEKFKNLRSLILDIPYKFNENLISQILKASKSIRLLAIYTRYRYNMPETIECLIHLRYLKAEYGILKLSRCISHLYHLQFVISKRPRDLVMDNNIGWEELRSNKNFHLIMTDEFVIEDLSVLLMDPQRSISSLCFLTIKNNKNFVSFQSETEPWFQKHSSTLIRLKFQKLQSLQSLPSLSTFSSLTYLKLEKIPLLKSLPDLPSSLIYLELDELKSLKCLQSSLSTFSSLRNLKLRNIPLLKSLILPDLPSSLLAISSLETLELFNIPLLESLPDFPSSLKELWIVRVESLKCLPSSLSTISSLRDIHLKELKNLDCLPSCLPTLLRILTIKEVPQLLELPDFPSSLKRLELKNLESLKCLPFSLSAISSLETLKLESIPLLKSLPDLPSTLKELHLKYFDSLQCLPSSLPAIYSLETLKLKGIPLLKSLPDLPSTLKELHLYYFKSFQCQPSSLSAISSLATLELSHIWRLKSLPDLPSSLRQLDLFNLDSLQSLPSSLSTIFSLTNLKLKNIQLLQSLPDLPSSLKVFNIHSLTSLQCLPSSLSTISSLVTLNFYDIPLLKSLPDLPSSLKELHLYDLRSLQCLPSSLSVISSLLTLELRNSPLLKSLPDLPSSLKKLKLYYLESFQRLPSSLSTISSLDSIEFFYIPLLESVPDLPASIKHLSVRNCHPQVMERCEHFKDIARRLYGD